jgi:ABC-type polysaccharide/polyol phosphate export permease
MKQNQRLVSFLKQTKILTVAGIRARYRDSWLGYIWVMLSPISTFAVQAFVFTQIFKLKIPHYEYYLILNLLPWYFFSVSVEMTSTALVFNARILKSSIADPFSLVVSKVNENLLNYFTAMAIGLTVVFFVTGEFFLTDVFLCLAALVPFYIVTCAACFVLACLNSIYFDIKFIASFALGLLFYLTPILYTENIVPEEWRWIIHLNPLTYLFKPFAAITHEGDYSPENFLYSYFAALCVLFLTFIFWKKIRNAVYARI